jgi:ComF family protein
VAFFDNPILRKAIHHFKYNNKQLLKDQFAPLLATCYHTQELKTEIIVPVPLHQKRHRERGYNQSHLLAQGLSTLINQPVDTKTLVRTRATQTQTKLTLHQRRQNVAEAFTCTGSTLQGRTILLIDDVCTTGATLDACAKALHHHAAAQVYALTLARAK